jgi:hypothetical protein
MSSWWKNLFRGKPKDGPPPEAVPAPAPRLIRRATLGLDFGTSSTKCCFREQSDGKSAHIVEFERAVASDSRVLFPTTIALDGGRLLFGHSAEQCSARDKLRSFKMCLLCLSRANRSDPALSAQSKCGNCLPDAPGFYRMGGLVLSAEDLSALYLSHVMRIAKQRLLATLGGDASAIRITVNSAAPLDQMDEFGRVGEHFERALFHGWMLADQSCNDWPIEQALGSLRMTQRENVPAVEQSPTRLFPETHAAMTAYLLLPQSERGLYGLVDIGAGTTDVAFFWFQKDEAETKAWYYAAGSRRVGMDDVDSALRCVLHNADGNLRAARQALPDEALTESLSLIEPVANEIRRHQATVLHSAMQVDQRPTAWRSGGRVHYRLFLAGGGSMCGQLRANAVDKPLLPGEAWEEPPSPLAIPLNTKVALADGTIVPVRSLSEPAVSRLLLLACGLAHPRPDIPKYERDVEGVKHSRSSSATVFELPDKWW